MDQYKKLQTASTFQIIGFGFFQVKRVKIYQLIN